MAGLALESQHKAEVPGPHGDWLYTFVRCTANAGSNAAAADTKVRRIAYFGSILSACDLMWRLHG